MGYWEQIGVENQKHRERRARKPRWRRVVEDAVVWSIITALGLVLWIIQLSPIWRMFW